MILFDAAVCEELVFSATRDCAVLVRIEQESLFDFTDLRQRHPIAAAQGERIANIVVINLPIFNTLDPAEDRWLYRGANSIHVDTSKEVIRDQLLMAPGDRIDESVVAESERILRHAKYLFDAAIVPYARCNDGIDLLVVTRDVWTLYPDLSFGRSGGSSKSSVGITDNNIFGTGNRGSLSFKSNADRDSITLAFKNDNLAGKHLELRTDYSDTSDGSAHKFSLSRPFYSLQTRWSAGFSTERSDLEEELSFHGQDDFRYQHLAARDEVFLGFSQGLVDGYTKRWTLGMTDTSETYKAIDEPGLQLPADRELLYPWIEWNWVEDRFVTMENLYQIHRTEDLSLGVEWRVRAGYAPGSWRDQESQWIVNAQVMDTLSDGKHHIFQASAHLVGAWLQEDDRGDNVLLSNYVEYHYLDNIYRRWYAKIQWDYGRHLTADRWLKLGGEGSLRGYPEDYYAGDQRYLFIIERRYFSDIHWFNLVRLGGAMFADIGKTTLAQDSDLDSPWLADLGVGLRLSSSKSSSGLIVHIDLAVPVVDRDSVDKYQWSITTKDTF